MIASCKGACRHRGFSFVGVVIVFPFSVTVLRLYRGSLKLATVPSLGPLGCSLPPPFPLFFFLRGILLPLGSAQPPPPSADSTSGLFVPAWWALASLSEMLPSLLLPPSGVGFRLLLPLFVVSVMTDDPGSNPRIFSNCKAADLTLSVFPEIIYFVADLGPSVRK